MLGAALEVLHRPAQARSAFLCFVQSRDLHCCRSHSRSRRQGKTCSCRYNIPVSQHSFEAVIKLARKIGRLRPPDGAIDPESPIVVNTQMLLCSSQNCVRKKDTGVAVAIEWIRNENLSVAGACIRHGITFGPSRVTRVSRLKFILDAKEKILELGLLDRPDIATPIDCDVVDRVRARFGGSQISLAVAADVVLVCNGSFDAACEHLRAQLGVEPQEEVQAAPTDLSDQLAPPPVAQFQASKRSALPLWCSATRTVVS